MEKIVSNSAKSAEDERKNRILLRIADLSHAQDVIKWSIRIVSAIFIGLAMPFSWYGKAIVAALMLIPWAAAFGWPVAFWQVMETYKRAQFFYLILIVYVAMLALSLLSLCQRKKLEQQIGDLVKQLDMPKVSQSNYSGNRKEKRKINQDVAAILIFASLFVLAIGMGNFEKISFKEKAPYETGTVLINPKEPKLASLTIETDGTGYYYFVLSKVGQKSRYMAFFALAGDTVEVKVPLGEYNISYACGKKWYGEDELFGKNTSYCQFDKTFDFIQRGDATTSYKITMNVSYPDSMRKLDDKMLQPGDFPK